MAIGIHSAGEVETNPRNMRRHRLRSESVMTVKYRQRRYVRMFVSTTMLVTGHEVVNSKAEADDAGTSVLITPILSCSVPIYHVNPLFLQSLVSTTTLKPNTCLWTLLLSKTIFTLKRLFLQRSTLLQMFMT